MSARVVLGLMLWWLPLLVRAAPFEVEPRLPVLEVVGVTDVHRPPQGRGLQLTFKTLPQDPRLLRLTVEDVRLLMAALTAQPSVPLARSAQPWGCSGCEWTANRSCSETARSSSLEECTKADYEQLFGASSVALSPLEDSRWFQALKLSPQYMGEGVREAARDLLGSPAVAYSMGLSMVLYMMAWAAPEPVFSKAFAASITLGLLMTYSAVELHAVGLACLNLYRDAEAARTQEQLDSVARRFGRTIGGVGLRVLVTIAGARLAKGMPNAPNGGLWARLSPPRFAWASGGGQSGFSLGTGARAQVNLAEGTVLLMGVSANTTAAAATAATTTRNTGACRDAADKGEARSHHIATNKNDTAEVRGGPWTPVFEQIFRRAGMVLDEPANIVHLVGHQGPHPEAYHQEIYRRLNDATSTCQTRAECRRKLIEVLDELAGDICKPESRLNKLLTKKP